MQQHFFQSFFGPQPTQIQQQIPEYITHNEMVLEIINNWEFVKNLMERYKAGKLQKLDQWENVWYNFIIGKNIDLSLYKTPEEFHKTFLIIPENIPVNT